MEAVRLGFPPEVTRAIHEYASDRVGVGVAEQRLEGRPEDRVQHPEGQPQQQCGGAEHLKPPHAPGRLDSGEEACGVLGGNGKALAWGGAHRSTRPPGWPSVHSQVPARFPFR